MMCSPSKWWSSMNARASQSTVSQCTVQCSCFASGLRWHFLMCRRRHSLALMWVLWINLWADIIYKLVLGDKDTFEMAFMLSGQHSTLYRMPNPPRAAFTNATRVSIVRGIGFWKHLTCRASPWNVILGAFLKRFDWRLTMQDSLVQDGWHFHVGMVHSIDGFPAFLHRTVSALPSGKCSQSYCPALKATLRCLVPILALLDCIQVWNRYCPVRKVNEAPKMSLPLCCHQFCWLILVWLMQSGGKFDGRKEASEQLRVQFLTEMMSVKMAKQYTWHTEKAINVLAASKAKTDVECKDLEPATLRVLRTIFRRKLHNAEAQEQLSRWDEIDECQGFMELLNSSPESAAVKSLGQRLSKHEHNDKSLYLGMWDFDLRQWLISSNSCCRLAKCISSGRKSTQIPLLPLQLFGKKIQATVKHGHDSFAELKSASL